MRFNLALRSLSALALFVVAMAANCATGEDLTTRTDPGLAGDPSTGTGGDVGSSGDQGSGGAGTANGSGGANPGTGGVAGGAGNANGGGAGTANGGAGNANGGGAGTANGGGSGGGSAMDSGMARGGGGTAGSGGMGGAVDASMGGAGGVSEASGASGTRDDAESEARNDAAIVAEGGEGGAATDANLTEANPGTVVFSDNFEGDAVGSQAAGWTRAGGSNGDWQVFMDMTRDFRQDQATSSTMRFCYAGPTISGAATVSARAKILLNGSSGATTGMVCVRYAVSGGAFECLALEPPGLRIKTSGGDGGPLSLPMSMTVTIGTSYNIALSVDATGLLRAYAGGSLLGTFQSPVSIPSGVVAVGTQSAEAAFDDVVLTVP